MIRRPYNTQSLKLGGLDVTKSSKLLSLICLYQTEITSDHTKLAVRVIVHESQSLDLLLQTALHD